MGTCFHSQSFGYYMDSTPSIIYKTSLEYMWELSYCLLFSILLQSQDNSSTNTHEGFEHLKETLVLKNHWLVPELEIYFELQLSICHFEEQKAIRIVNKEHKWNALVWNSPTLIH